MTDEKRRAAIKKLIAERTAANTVSKAVARETLINEGIYTREGKLHIAFGGPRKKAARVA